jgi:hypothetical protein
VYACMLGTRSLDLATSCQEDSRKKHVFKNMPSPAPEDVSLGSRSRA